MFNFDDSEDRSLRRLRRIVDRTAGSLSADPLSEREARQLVENTRRNVLVLFPDKAREFDLIYRPRFERLLEQNSGVQCDRALRRARLRPEGGDRADS
ncbi:MAG: hypothetical protein R3231_11960 [bacterium]|nr:hypothetical protein [bacterium]